MICKTTENIPEYQYLVQREDTLMQKEGIYNKLGQLAETILLIKHGQVPRDKNTHMSALSLKFSSKIGDTLHSPHIRGKYKRIPWKCQHHHRQRNHHQNTLEQNNIG